MKFLKSVSDKELINRLHSLVKKEQNLTLEILPFLAEVGSRGLYLAKGCSDPALLTFTRGTVRTENSNVQSRYIPQSVKVEVWNRYGGRCGFVASNGKRCNSIYNLQIDHYPVPFARGGRSSVDNLRLLCAKHNRYTAEQVYGKNLMGLHYHLRKSRERGAQAPRRD